MGDGGSADITLKTSLEPRTIGILQSVRAFMGEKADAPLLDGPEISRSLAASPGIKSVSLRNTDSAALEGEIEVSKVDDFLAAGSGNTRFISYAEGIAPGTSSIVISLDMNSAPEIISQLSPEAEEYLSALMAPAVLGEVIPRQEYLDLITSVYGRALANEITSARIHAFIDFPRPVISVQGGTASGRRAEFNVPLLDILVLDKPLRYEVKW